MTTTPDVSLLLVTHNHVAFVDEALTDIEAQQIDRPFEVVIADDASTDGTRERLEAWAEGTSVAARVLPPGERLGITANYARGFAACTGRYIAVLEGDDRWIDDSKVETLAAYLDANPAVSFAFNRSVVWFEAERTGIVQPPVGLEAAATTFDASYLAQGNIVATFSSCMYRRELLERVDPKVFDVTAYDWLVNLAMAKFGPFGLVPRVMTAYRVHDRGAWSGMTDVDRTEQLAELIVDYEHILGSDLARDLARHRRSLRMQLEAIHTAGHAEDRPRIGSGAPGALMTLKRRRASHRPRVSVVMPAHNHELFVEEAIHSVLDQTVDDLELVVVDDGSSDETAKRVASVADERIRFYRFFPNHGACSAMNLALQQTSADLVAVLNSDDAWEPTKLERQLAVLDDDRELGAVFTGVKLVSDIGRPLRTSELPEWHDVFRQPNRSPGRWLRTFWELGNVLCHPSALIRRSVYEEIGYYDNRLRQIPDFALWIKLAKHVRFTVLGDEELVRFRVFRNQTNASSQTPQNVARNLHEHLLLCKSFFEGCSPEMLRDGFSDLFADPMSASPEELECEQTLMWLNGASKLHPIYRFHGIQELYRLLGSPAHRDLLRRRYGVDDFQMHEHAAQLGSEHDRAMLDPSGWLAPAFARNTAVPSGVLAAELVRRVRGAPIRRWPRRVFHHLRHRGG